VKDDIVEDVAVDNKKCYKCGKEFKYQSHLERHVKNKTLCIIQEVDAKDLANPNRCIYCNKTMSRKPNLIKHLKTCKVKNGGIEILDDNVRHMHEIRILKEHRDVDRHKIANLEHQNHEIMQQLAKLVEQNALIITQMTHPKNAAD
jgi:hypothetical protein